MLASRPARRLQLALLALPLLALLPAVAHCSSSSSPPVTAAATIAGPTVGPVRSAALIVSGAITEAGSVGAMDTYVQFYSAAPGTSCTQLDAGSLSLAGNLSVPGPPSVMNGRQLVFGQTPDVFLTLVPASASVDASDGDGGAPDEAGDQLVAVGGTVSLVWTSGALRGTLDAQMVLASDPGGAPVQVTGTFSAPACGD